MCFKFKSHVFVKFLLFTYILLIANKFCDGNINLKTKVYRIFPDTLNKLILLRNIQISDQIDFWKESSKTGDFSDVMVLPDYQMNFENFLFDNEFNYTITIRDLEKLIQDKESKINNDHKVALINKDSSWSSKIMKDNVLTLNRRVSPGYHVPPDFDLSTYHSYDEIIEYIENIERRFPDIAKKHILGTTYEQKDIYMIQIGHPLNDTNKKAIWIDAGIHAREWLSVTTALYFIHSLVTGYKTNVEITKLVENLTWYITPVLNPDGYEYTRTSSDPRVRLWRKNRSPNSNQKCNWWRKECCDGVDLNRNFGYHWSKAGSSGSACSPIYHGESEFSEAESKAVQNFVLSHKNELAAFITMHSYSQLWLYPFGDAKRKYPPDVENLKNVGKKAANALKSLYGTEFKVGTGADLLYAASGTSDDWVKSLGGIPYVYLLELRPKNNVINGFIVDKRQIMPTSRETWEGVKVVANAVIHGES